MESIRGVVRVIAGIPGHPKTSHVWMRGVLERETGIEPATLCLEGRCSTTELLPLALHYIAHVGTAL